MFEVLLFGFVLILAAAALVSVSFRAVLTYRRLQHGPGGRRDLLVALNNATTITTTWRSWDYPSYTDPATENDAGEQSRCGRGGRTNTKASDRSSLRSSGTASR